MTVLSNDGVGLALADMLRNRLPGVDVAVSAMIGLSLFDIIIGYDTIVIIDAMTTKEGQLGEVKKIHEDERCGTLHFFSSHGLNIFDLMKLGEQCGLQMPHLAAVYGIEIGNEVAFDENFSPNLIEILPAIAKEIIADMTTFLPSLSASAAN